MNETTSIKLRPDFLTVLCILTFIGSGYGIINSTTSYFKPDNQEVIVEIDDAFEEAMDNNNLNEEQRDMFENFRDSLKVSLTSESIKNISIVNILSYLATLAGAFLMWNLTKKGFFVYIFGILIMIGGTLAVYDGIIGALMTGASAFVGILFIILYGANLKHMR